MLPELHGLDETKALILMSLGGVFALAGLYLLVRPHQAAGETRIEFLGLKFNASSAGIVVFLTGALFLVLPAFVPESSGPGQSLQVSASDPDPDAGGKPPIILPPGPDAAEQEPNNTVQDAKEISRGSFYTGIVDGRRDDSDDWFVVPTSDVENQDIRVQIRLDNNPVNSCHAFAYNDKEEQLDRWTFSQQYASVYQDLFVGSSIFILLRIHALGKDQCRYQLKVH